MKFAVSIIATKQLSSYQTEVKTALFIIEADSRYEAIGKGNTMANIWYKDFDKFKCDVLDINTSPLDINLYDS
jgi:hypothetical protein